MFFWVHLQIKVLKMKNINIDISDRGKNLWLQKTEGNMAGFSIKCQINRLGFDVRSDLNHDSMEDLWKRLLMWRLIFKQKKYNF